MTVLRDNNHIFDLNATPPQLVVGGFNTNDHAGLEGRVISRCQEWLIIAGKAQAQTMTNVLTPIVWDTGLTDRFYGSHA